MKKILTAILFAITFTIVPANAFTMDVQGGIANHVSELSKFNMSFYGHWWFPIDKMTFVGVGGGYEELDNVGYVPLSASLWVRLPIGRQVLPVAIGDLATSLARTTRCSGVRVVASISRTGTTPLFCLWRDTSTCITKAAASCTSTQESSWKSRIALAYSRT